MIKKLTADFKNDSDRANAETSLLARALNLKSHSLQEVILKGRRFRRFLNPKLFIFPKDTFKVPIFIAIEREIVNISDLKLKSSIPSVGI